MAGGPLRRREALVFVDESGFHTSMARLRARAPRGERAYGKEVPRKRGRNQTLIASITLDGRRHGRVGLHRGGDRRGALRGPYVERFLAPSLSAGQVGSCSRRLGAHRPRKIRELIEAREADLLFLPPYSPDLNPIEQAFSKIKQLVRKAGARTRGALDEAVSEALGAVTPEDAAGWFAHCGYRAQDQPL